MSAIGQQPSMSLAHLLEGRWLPGDVGEITVAGLCLDHRLLNPGDVFIAVPGTRHDGRRFISEAVGKSIAAVLKEAESPEETIQWSGAVPIIPVPQLSASINQIAGQFYGHPSRRMRLIGMTGTNGKTTCSYLLAQLLTLLGRPSGVAGTLGYGLLGNAGELTLREQAGLTTADPVSTQRILAELLNDGAEFVAMEVSSHSLAQHRVADLQFAGALFTNLSRDHLDYHGDMASYGAAKSQLFDMPGLGYAVINRDDAFGQQLIASKQKQLSVLSYSTRTADADIYAPHQPQQAGIRTQLQSPWGSAEINTQLVGEFNLSNLLAVIAVACAEGWPLVEVIKAIPHLRPVAGRMHVVASDLQPLVVVDYAHTPDSLQNALQTLASQTAGKLWCVFGCGGDRDSGKRPLMAQEAEKLAEFVVVTSDNPRHEPQQSIWQDIRAGFVDSDAVHYIESREAAIAYAIQQAAPDDTVLIAGKGHEEYQQIGDARLPFSDVKHARVALRSRKVGGAN